MSWGFTVVGKPSEVGEKVRKALASSRNGQPSHAATFDGIEAVVNGAGKEVQDETVSPTWRTDRLLVVESSGHIDSNAASVTLTIKTAFESASLPPAEAPVDTENHST